MDAAGIWVAAPLNCVLEKEKKNGVGFILD